jgi:uncharacterized repeat protein (TIGR01451 family)
MKSRLFRVEILAMLLGIAVLIALTSPAQAKDKTPATQPPPAKNPASTPVAPEKQLPPGQAQGIQINSGVDYRTSALNARGTHAGETSQFMLTIVNQGSDTGAATEAYIHLPANASYVPDSAQAQGGGTLTASPSMITWMGAVANGSAITITYNTVLPFTLGEAVTTTATIYDPQLPGIMSLENRLTVQPSSGGPDGFGYTFQDSLAPGGAVTYSWVPTSTLTPTVDLGPYPVDDSFSAALPIGFSFRFYQNSYTELYVNSNGLVMFGAGTADNIPKPIPTHGATDNFASCLWSDLYMLQAHQGAWIETFGSAPNRYTVITFEAAYFPEPSARPALFQMILYETSNRIKCQYAHTSGPYYGSGGQAQIGLENGGGTAGLSYFFSLDQNHVVIGPLQDGLAIEFTPGPPTLPVLGTSSLSASANVHPGDMATYTVLIRNTGTAGSANTTLTDPIPANTTYVAGSAMVLGGGTLDANASHVNWSGTVAPSATVTVTYQVQLPNLLGSQIVNTATIAAPQAAVPVVLVNKDLLVMPSPTGGPDTFGYTYADSFAGVSYNWVPTTTSSSKLNFGTDIVDDVYTGTIPIGFPFRFYANTYTDFYVSSNGLVSFGAGHVNNTNLPIPNTFLAPKDRVNNYAACFWSDLYIQNASQGVWVETYGSAPNRYTVITFLTQYFVTAGDLTVPPSLFQMIMYETSNQIKCQYEDVGGTLMGSGGIGATVGLENADGTSGIQYYYQIPYTIPAVHGPLENHLAILFAPGALAPSFSASSKQVSPQMHPGETVTYTLVISNNASIPSSLTALSDPIPAGATYVDGSAQAHGGGLLNITPGNVGWQGTVVPSNPVSVTFSVVLEAPFGPVSNTATIQDPAAFFPQEISAFTPVQPSQGFGVGLPSYFYQDSYTPGITYSWIPTTSASTPLSITVGDYDDGYGSLPLGFDFTFFDRSYANVQISTNGLVMFNDVGTTLQNNQPILTPGTVDNYASCFWDDQLASISGQGIWLETFGSAPNRYAVITFELRDFDQPMSQPYLYQMILYENNGAIQCQYAHMGGSINGDGRSATIGLEDRFGTSGVQYFTERAQPPMIGPVEDGLAIIFKTFGRIYLPAVLNH